MGKFILFLIGKILPKTGSLSDYPNFVTSINLLFPNESGFLYYL